MPQRTEKPILIRRQQVEAMTSLSRSRIYALIKTGEFPPPIRLGAQSVAWVRTDIDEWIVQRIEASKPI
ncbi:MAG: AlpA family phage regulatory protein [Betaproteobacteria bacterium]|jgi:Predicted transcriptional regulator|nr:AlpA family phage regulatory protein [Betaproteobacteria bacterium]